MEVKCNICGLEFDSERDHPFKLCMQTLIRQEIEQYEAVDPKICHNEYATIERRLKLERKEGGMSDGVQA